MIIDACSHMLHGGSFDQLAASGGDWTKKLVASQRKSAEARPQTIDVALRVEQLDRYGVDLQVVTPGSSMDVNLLPGDAAAQLAMARAVNDSMARLMEDSKGRLIAAGVIPFRNFEKGGRREMERAINTLGLKAFNLPSNINGKPLDLPEFEPFWAQATEMGVPVYIHPVNPIGQTDRSYEAEYELPLFLGWPFETALCLARLVFSGIMERYPTLKVVSHHLGGGLIPFFMGRADEIYDPSYVRARGRGTVTTHSQPKPLFDYFSRFYYDTAVGGSAAALRCAYEVFGADQMVFATDLPGGPDRGVTRLGEYPKVIRSLGLSEAENNKILGDNSRKILNLV